MNLDRVFVVHNHLRNVPVQVIPWVNCGMGSVLPEKDQPLIVDFAGRKSAAPVMFDREDPEVYGAARAYFWEVIADSTECPRIAFDPLRWDPWQLRTEPWYLRWRGWLGTSTAQKHMESRRGLMAGLGGRYGAVATDLYVRMSPSGAFALEDYTESARLKTGAHVRVCREFQTIPVVLVNLDSPAPTIEARNAAVLQRQHKDLRIGIWGDPTNTGRTVEQQRLTLGVMLASIDDVRSGPRGKEGL